MTQHRKLSHRISYLLLRAIEGVFRLLPIAIVWRIGAALGSLTHFLTKKRRTIVAKNLSFVRPDWSPEQCSAEAKQIFRYSFGNLFSSLKTGTMSNAKLSKHLEIITHDALLTLPPETGCVCLLLHMSNWELLGRVNDLRNSPKQAGAMYRPLNNDFIDEHIKSLRESTGTRLFSRKKGMKQAYQFLSEGNILGVLADQHAGASGVQLPLFGEMTSISPLVVMLAQKYQFPIFPVSLTTVSPGNWRLEFLAPITVEPELSKEEAIKKIMPAMESIMSTHLRDIFWLHDRWKLKRRM